MNIADRRRRQWVPFSAYFPHTATPCRLREEFGRDGLLVWALFLAACKRSPEQGTFTYASEESGWVELGLADPDDRPDFTLEVFFSFCGQIKQTRRGRRTGLLTVIEAAHWDDWQDVATRRVKAERKASKRRQDAAETLPERGQDAAKTLPERRQDAAETLPERRQDAAETLPERGQTPRSKPVIAGDTPEPIRGSDLDLDRDLDRDQDQDLPPGGAERAVEVVQEGRQNGHRTPVDPSDESTSRELVAYFVDMSRSRGVEVPQRVVGHLAREVKNLLDEGQPPTTVGRGLERMLERRVVQPGLLAGFLVEASLPTRASARSQRIRDAGARHAATRGAP